MQFSKDVIGFEVIDVYVDNLEIVDASEIVLYPKIYPPFSLLI